ncbi:glycine oxidase ThiO [Merismopedia glauca]|uniref:glycine oxidase n=1 Tax=Merismopedia glauca CCAP 1448/3 TaxID=1296344 RepID=A0A2T1BX92_9CYAN|nr:glycine oxidase ThiO [Merismopedia glauca]PSB00611.1 glycine oxidase ThiO [Merismopedia glauca CCAP 1448/3]
MSEILIIGGGIMGMAIALELRSQGAEVTILSRNFKEAATHAAAGMLAPQAEGIAPGPMLDLCLQSRAFYGGWCDRIEEITGAKTGYWGCGILAPVYTLPQNNSDYWLDRDSIHQFQPGLSDEVGGGYWYPEDGQVDNRALAQALWLAMQKVGVNVREGVEVHQIQHHRAKINCVETNRGTHTAQHYILATGAWSQELLPIPVYPKKGQMLSLRVPQNILASFPLHRVLFGSHIYIVPRQDGRIIIGATSEDVGFTPKNTARGIQSLLNETIRLYPQLKDFAIEELWWGYRPTTPDELPILGTSPYENLTLATGHHRNGILLAPITGLLITKLIGEGKLEPLLPHFHYSRFSDRV